MANDARIEGGRYLVSPEEIERFRRDGYVHLRGVLTPAEVAEIETTYMRFLRREIPVEGRDFCDMSGDYTRPIEQFSLINVMLPRRYFPAWRDNVYETRARSIAEQLIGADVELDYDQLLAKPPRQPSAVFHWHQDLAYWPVTPDSRTASFWLAIDDASVENGCMRFVVGSHLEPRLRPHLPLHGDREKSHTLVAHVDETKDVVRPAEIARGDVTVHSERTVHGSGGNVSDRWRRAYIMAYRSRSTVAAERAMGFTHSHNDDLSVLNKVGWADR